MTLNAERLATVESWITAYMADVLDMPATEVDLNRPFDQYGLDSAATVAFASDLGRWLGTKLDTKIMFEFDTIRAVSDHLRGALGSLADVEAMRA